MPHRPTNVKRVLQNIFAKLAKQSATCAKGENTQLHCCQQQLSLAGLRELARSGIGIVVISSEMPELLGLADRVLVVREGRIAGELGADEMSEEAVIRLASGLATAQATDHAA